MVLEKEIKSFYTVPLLDGAYTGDMAGYTVTIEFESTTTYFKCTNPFRMYGPCKVVITKGFAEVTMID